MVNAHIVTIVVAIYAFLLVVGIIREHIESLHIFETAFLSWEQTVRSLTAVRSYELRQIAAGASTGDDQRNGSEMLQALGGLEGLERLQHNGIVLAALARHTQQFIAETDRELVLRVEASALKIKRTIMLAKMLLALRCGKLVSKLVITKIALMYCQTVAQLIMLYTTTHVSRRDRIIAACDW